MRECEGDRCYDACVCECRVEEIEIMMRDCE